ncbi:DUF4294 domain-containing protein [Flavobacterium sp. SUN052]|uniref:DUF4294 domain-containing protein n=1 Tax=Flavobacterium sp. SUN052 TaxID=3002441 RepID=UPI00237D93EA|nr:DUF4294 domain-containing protein [Flavobacterium sp. SUN052]MEC4005897.1 DUF4294 domain-containing protein [Flavobacterium sp. SUN052]
MHKNSLLILFLFVLTGSFAQVAKDLQEKDIAIKEIDTVKMDTILLDEVLISKVKLNTEELKQFQLLQNRVYKVYPFAKTAADRLSMMNKTMDKLNSNKEKKKYFKIVEDYLENEFKDNLKKLSRKQGQILVKLIHRQTGISTYDLIKDYKSGWKAFWSNNTARLFDINLKETYRPFENNEDFLIETILYRAFTNGRLVEQKSSNPVDIDELNEHWEKLAKELSKKKG